MIQIQNIPLPIGGGMEQLRKKAAQLLGVRPGALQSLTLVRQSIDARSRTQIHYVCTVHVTVSDEAAVLRRSDPRRVRQIEPTSYRFPQIRWSSPQRPVVVGMGPAGLFAALYLARNGLPVLLLERGRPVEARTEDVERFWASGTLDPESNVPFGEGGAGTFSDGKLTTGIHDPRVRAVLTSLVQAGAPDDILYQHNPHIGTDLLRQVVRAIREELIALGCEIRFCHRLDGLEIRGGALAGIRVAGPEGPYALSCDTLILAPGHSARDTFAMLQAAGAPMEPKPFAIGVRIEHWQAQISQQQYGSAWEQLPPASYKLSCHLPGGRSAYTFCVCPGGQVVAAASEPGLLVTNGMSFRARDGKIINGGFLVNVTPEDFDGPGPLAGAAFQERWEKAAFRLGGGAFRAPVQTVADFLAGRPSSSLGALSPTYRPGVTPSDLSLCLPGFVADALRAALPLFDQRLRGFAAPHAVLTGIETRSSSPVRILRDSTFQSQIRGLYPCGEGAGYAGGIVSAAVDGIRTAEAVAQAG